MLYTTWMNPEKNTPLSTTKPEAKGQTFWDFTYMKYLEKANSERQKKGLRKRKMGRYSSVGTLSVGVMKKLWK